jgi:hypothetical protein
MNRQPNGSNPPSRTAYRDNAVQNDIPRMTSGLRKIYPHFRGSGKPQLQEPETNCVGSIVSQAQST